MTGSLQLNSFKDLVLQKKRLRWFGHVERMSDANWVTVAVMITTFFKKFNKIKISLMHCNAISYKTIFKGD